MYAIMACYRTLLAHCAAAGVPELGAGPGRAAPAGDTVLAGTGPDAHPTRRTRLPAATKSGRAPQPNDGLASAAVPPGAPSNGLQVTGVSARAVK